MFSMKTLCSVGSKLSQCETPALLLCMETVEKNLSKMKEMMKQFPGVRYRPHAKAHKCPMIAHLQLLHGASGVCCQTLTEAEAMVEGGIKDIFISNQVIGQSKLFRLASLARSASVSVSVDDEKNISDLSAAASSLNVQLELVVEVNVGQDRAGIEPGADVARLAKKVLALPNVAFKGIQCYNGSNQHIRVASEKKAAVDKVVEKSKKALEALKDSGIECNYVTGGGTGTFQYEAASGVFTEVQPGSYIFMDVDYSKNLDDSGIPVSDFEQSLFVMATVQSVSPGDRAILDAGLKAISLDSGPPRISGRNDLTVNNGGDEHGVVRPCGGYKVGDHVWLIPGHCDPTVNMHNMFIGVRGDHVECVWPITGRGPGV